MKKWKVFLSCLFILIFIMSSSANAKGYSSNYITVRYDGKSQSVRQVPVIMDGQAVQLDVPSFITMGATFVPIRFVAEKYGAKVDWDQNTKTAFITNDDIEMALTIGSNQIYINGQKKVIDSTWVPKLVTFDYGTSKSDSRTMVPLRLISETLGYEVGYDEESKVPFINSLIGKGDDKDGNANKVNNVAVVRGSTSIPKVTITGTEKIKYSTLSLNNPSRLVIDIENAVLDIKDGVDFEGGIGRIDVDKSPIERISISQFTNDPKVVRVVIRLSKESDFDIVPSDDGKSITIFPVNKISKIEKEIIDGKEAIVVYNAGDAEIRTMKLKNPTRIVMDLLDSSLEGGDYFTFDYQLGFVKGLRVSQFLPDNLYSSNDRIVRIVLDVMDGIINPEAGIIAYDDRLIIIPETNLQEVIKYYIEGSQGFISINTSEETEYSVNYIEEDKTMIVEVPSDKLETKEGYLSISDGLVEDIVVTEKDGMYQFQINFVKSIEYTVLSEEKTDEISLCIVKSNVVKPYDRTIVIDAGHGGHDPGTIPNGVKEKDINLAVALKLSNALKEKGYNVILTRDEDVFVDLTERAEIANRNNADIFISLHSNSISNPDIKGIQVLYCPAFNSDVKETDNYPLSKAIMDALIQGTGAVNKGIIKRPELAVLRKTKMSATLIEMGFLTNKEEAAKLQTESYQNLIVESIVKGIENYFDEQ